MGRKTRNKLWLIFLTVAITILNIPISAFAEENIFPPEDEVASSVTTEETTVVVTENATEEIIEPESAAEEQNSEGAISKPINEIIGEKAVSLMVSNEDIKELVDLSKKTEEASVTWDGEKITVDAGGLILYSNFEKTRELVGYTIFLSSLNGTYADLTKTITIEGTEYSFLGLGSDTFPFSGTIQSQDKVYGMILNTSLFNNVNVEATEFADLSTLKIKRKESTTALLASKITGFADETWKSFEIQAEVERITDGGTTTTYMPGQLIDTMESGASLSLGTVTYTDGAAVSVDSGNAGLLCNTMQSGSSLSVQQLSVILGVTITANSGSAGGLVGLMNTGTSLAVGSEKQVEIGSNYTITGTNAGGLIGEGIGAILSGNLIISGAKVTGKSAAGGLIGYYSATGTGNDYDGSLIKVNQVSLETGKYAGGLFGILDLQSDYSISNASVNSTISGKNAYYGGLIGQVKGNASEPLRTLMIQGSEEKISTSTSGELYGYGGAVAVIGGDDSSCPVYVKIAGTFYPDFTGEELLKKDQYFGGIAAYLKEGSVIEIAERAEVKPTGCNQIVYGGGVLGKAERGSTLCLNGTTNLSDTQFDTKNIGITTGQIVGTQESALIYAKSDWKLIRQSEAQAVDDIGTYGEVIRLGGNMGMGAPVQSGLSAGFIYQDPTTHKTTFSVDLSCTVSSAEQFARLAIEEQTKGAFHGGSNYYLESNANITLEKDISLAHTGIMGLQRDINNLGYEYSGTLDGGGHTLTVSVGEIYGYRDTDGTQAIPDTVGSGQIHGHNQVGLFSQASNGTMKNLTVDGEMNLWFRDKKNENVAGGLVAKQTQEGTFENITTKVTINIYDGGVYAGGLIGSYSGAKLTIKSATLSGKLKATGTEDACFGGLVSRIAYIDKDGAYSEAEVTLTDIKVSSQQIEATNISKTCGGLLGYEWNNASVTVGNKTSHDHGVIVDSDSQVKITGAAKGAGLVFTATGYWQVNDIDLKKLSVKSGNGDFGLLICRGWKKDNDTAMPYLLYVEETDHEAYKIAEDKVCINNDVRYFDDWVVFTCQDPDTIAEDEVANTITDNGNSVISIATPAGNIVEGVREGITGYIYKNRTNIKKDNSYSRYYYDLDKIRENVSNVSKNKLVDTRGELVLWSVWRYAEKTNGKPSNIYDYFKTDDIASIEIDGGKKSIDLKGYAYYPVTVDGSNLIVKDITIEFADQKIETNQHYLMNSGLLLNYINSTDYKDVTLAVNNVTFKGSIGKGLEGNGSGALICGQMGGIVNPSNPRKTILDIDGLTLSGIVVNADKTATATDYAPLLVNCVGSHISLTAQNVSFDRGDYDGYNSENPAATSLIGHVGSEEATNISLAFHNNIDLSGRKTDSIFSHATLLESFQYTDANSSGYYYFKQNDNCTYGKEITGSIENEGQQNFYYFEGKEETSQVKDRENMDFGDYLPYVCHPYPGENNKFHELEVNITMSALPEGCGTYDDPYIINNNQVTWFVRVAQFINGGTPRQGWKVNKVCDPEQINKKDETSVIEENSEAEENTHHETFIVGDNWDDDSIMREYLRGAYYKIEENLSLINFPGLGSVIYPFVGVIEGSGNTVTISAEKNESGLINVSYGSVVRNLNIIYTGTKNITGTQPSDNGHEVTEKSYFGGIIGTVKGGDSLIESVTVTFQAGVLDGFPIMVSNELQCAGGFVGLIQGGGVVFRKMSDNSVNRDIGLSDKNYVDKYIGRVLDGYAINEEGDTLSGNNYSIPGIKNNGSITWNNGTITINHPEQMILFTDIINSGAASGGTSLAYASGAKTRNADYSKIGAIDDDSDTAFLASRKDDKSLGEDNYPYLITKYASKEFWSVCSSGTPLSVTINGPINLSSYGNGYRGIGGRYNCTASQNKENKVGDLTLNTPLINTVTGNSSAIKVLNEIAEYQDDNFRANAVGGLFNVLRHSGAKISNVNVLGTVKLSSGLGQGSTITGITEKQYLDRAPVGGIIGQDYSSQKVELNMDTVSFGNSGFQSEVYGECVTGGLVGSSGSKKQVSFEDNNNNNNSYLTFTDCSYQKVSITGGLCTGGLVGASVSNMSDFAKFSANDTCTDKTLTIESTDTVGSSSTIYNMYDNNTNSAVGVGGLIGFCSIKFTIQGKEIAPPVLMDDVTIYGGAKNMKARVGGLVGFVCTSQKLDECTIKNVNLTDMKVGLYTSDKKYEDNAGGFIGTWYANGSLSITQSGISGSKIVGNSAGGIVGYAERGSISVKDITLSGITLERSEKNYVGGLGGQVSIDFDGQNILMQNIKYSDEKDVNNLGRFFGKGGNSTCLLGVVIQQDNKELPGLPVNDIKGTLYTNYGKKNYVVYSGYRSSEVITNVNDIVSKPSRTIAGIEDLHGDTINPETVVNIVNDKDYYYQNLSAAGVTKEKFSSQICSTYNAHQDTKIESDFPVVLIDGDASVLRQYLNAATNGGFDSMRDYDSHNKLTVDIVRYLYNKDTSSFTKADEQAGYLPTLIYHKDTGEFTTTAQFDNQQNTFTLVTVTMKGKYDEEPFVLHIPVIVRRMLQVDFMATMTSGTVFNKTDSFYKDTMHHALAPVGENITGYLTFQYNSNASDITNPASYDWKSYMEGGGDLLGYYKKTVETGAALLPVGTKITLIDCQDEDKRYYADVKQETKLELFYGGNLEFKTSDDAPFEPSTLSDLLEVQANIATEEEKSDPTIVKWVMDDSNATVKAVEGVTGYYRRYDEQKDKTVTDLYVLDIGNQSPKENYFVVISVPYAESHRMTMNKNGMVWNDDKKTSPPLEVHQVHRYDPTKCEEKSDTTEATFNYLNNYDQILKDKMETENKEVQVTNATVDIPIHVTNEVSFDPTHYTDTDRLYQKFVVSLKKIENAVATNVGLPSDAVSVSGVKLYAYYGDGENRHYYVFSNGNLTECGSNRTPAITYSWSGSTGSTEMVLPFAEKTSTGYQYINLGGLRIDSGNKFYLEAEAMLELSVASVLSNNTIPYNDSESAINKYTQLDIDSILSFTESGLSYSTLCGNTLGNQKYYLNTARNAILKLDYTNVDQLGINAREDKEAVINTVLTLDLSNMEGFVTDVQKFKTLSEADSVTFTLSLKKKNDDGVYQEVLIGDYMISADNLTNYGITLRKNSDGSYPYYDEQTGHFTIPISFKVNMDVKQYANYRICANVALQKGSNTLELNVDESDAYITYTFAKINVNGYWN